MPNQSPSLKATLSFCVWYFASNVEVPEFKINSTGLKVVNSKYKEKLRQQAQGKKVRAPGFQEYTALSAGSEAEHEGQGETRGQVSAHDADEALAEARVGEKEQIAEAVGGIATAAPTKPLARERIAMAATGAQVEQVTEGETAIAAEGD